MSRRKHERASAADPLASVTGLSHVAIAVEDAEAYAARMVTALGAVRGEEELLDDGALKIVFVQLGPVTFELLEPRRPDHTVARFLEHRGPGLHHVSLEVEDVGHALDRCRAAGVQLIDEEPREGANGSLVAFLHPKGMGGVLIELSQPGKPTA
jgi:methylmalonyl-CoA/ethylmalonyl-CoA epimerase